MQYKALFLDIDDTLIGNDKQISPGNLEAIRKAQRAGIHVTVSTGRGYLASSRIWRELNIQGPVIVYGGAVIMDTRTDTTLYCAAIDQQVICEALQAAHEWGLHAQIFQGDEVICEEHDEFVQRYTTNMGLPLRVEPRVREMEWQNVPKVLVYAPGEQEWEMVARFEKRFAGKLEVASSKPGYIELNRIGVNKGTTMMVLADMLEIRQEEIIGVGDNTLDRELIRMAGLGVCVANGQQSMKELADVVAPACEDDGVKWVIENYLLAQ